MTDRCCLPLPGCVCVARHPRATPRTGDWGLCGRVCVIKELRTLSDTSSLALRGCPNWGRSRRETGAHRPTAQESRRTGRNLVASGLLGFLAGIQTDGVRWCSLGGGRPTRGRPPRPPRVRLPLAPQYTKRSSFCRLSFWLGVYFTAVSVGLPACRAPGAVCVGRTPTTPPQTQDDDEDEDETRRRHDCPTPEQRVCQDAWSWIQA